MKDIQLSENFWLSEFLKSQTAERHKIDNFPSEQYVVDNLKSIAQNVLQPLRWAYDKPIAVSSGYRCLELNRRIVSKYNSQHIFGYAADFEIWGVPNLEVAEFIRDELHFDQVILEFWTGGNSGWIHCSYVNDVKNRHNSLTINKNGVFNGFQIK